MAVINTNISAVRAANASNTAAHMAGISMERLSTGKRINGAKDDAAGLAIATTMTSQIKGMGQGIRNANDGISFAQTADGALNEVTAMLQRVRELAIQAKSATYQPTDRGYMDAEVQELATQITSVLGNTKFNGNNVFGAANQTFIIQVGADTGDTVSITSKGIAAVTFDVTTVAGAATTMGTVDTALDQVSAARASFGAGQNRLESVVNNLNDNVTNLSDARSRILDTDYSAETTQMAKAQILAQASTAMIAQANQAQQNVLSLLK
ncbi:flagellin [Novosphingobium sp. KCTC 2891]|uniref:flagellin N-terminal helical domain-containing protein n=1 Tax=Novosphingobium sp. KCTC 2891 TaxID=2989730 RepID=UPI002222672B|nr:flagellin [Novosphingobium sp. KCTC 2891]MCW1381457.1 flagellin [Novosphingobium sp. KCTC 2891]